VAQSLLVRLREGIVKQAKFEDLFLEELGDLYDAEKQIMATLPKMIAASSSGELARALQQHLDETREHVARLERIFEEIGEEVRGRDSIGMKGLVESGESLIEDVQKSTVLDAALIAAAQKVAHYEISAYGTVRTMAEMLGQENVANALQETLDEESAIDEALTYLSESIINDEAIAEDAADILGEEEDEEIREGA
jgi:ferritin-like metal-binding protein YciE